MTEPEGTLVVLADRRGGLLAEDWSPREALLSMITAIDAGLEVRSLIICYDGIKGSGFKNATTSALDAIGLLQVTQLEVYARGREQHD